MLSPKLGTLYLVVGILHSIWCAPSVEPHPNFDAKADANAIHTAFGGGVDEAKLKEVFCTRSCKQRAEITAAFHELFRKDLEEVIARHTGRAYEQLLKDSLICGDALAALHLHRALTRFRRTRRRDKKNVIEIMVTYSESAEKHANLTAAYQSAFGHDPIDEISDELRHDFKHVMKELATVCMDSMLRSFEDFVSCIREMEPNFQERIVDNQTLESRISDDIEGSFKGLLLGYLKGSTSSGR